MNNKVIIITPPIYAKSLEKGFNAINWDVLSLPFGINDNKGLVKNILWRLFPKQEQTKSFNNKITVQLPELIAKHSPKFVLVVKGNNLSESSIKVLKTLQIPVVLWTLDSTDRFSSQLDIAAYCKHIFFQDGIDVAKYTNSTWLPFAYDNTIFSAEPTENKVYDILYIGYLKMPYYATRLKYLNILIESGLGKKYRVAFAGSTGSAQNDNELKERLEKSGIKYLGKQSIENYAKAIKSSKTCVNIHQDDGEMPINPMLFAIAGVKTCQVAEDKEHITKWMSPETDYCAVNESNFIEELQNLVADEEKMNFLIKNSYLKVIERDTYTGRAKTIVKAVGY